MIVWLRRDSVKLDRRKVGHWAERVAGKETGTQVLRTARARGRECLTVIRGVPTAIKIDGRYAVESAAVAEAHREIPRDDEDKQARSSRRRGCNFAVSPGGTADFA